MADGKGFDLGAMLAGLTDVSNLDTGREQIEYIRLHLIDNDPNNFYQLSGIEDLAANIATCGLQQPIRVRKHPETEGRYMIVSGHRRRAALELLYGDDPERWNEIPCIVEADTVSTALQQLRLIYANASTRRMTNAELGEEAAQVEKLLYELKEQGYEFPGRMRDHVAQAVGASQSKLARLKVIRDNLAPCWRSAYEDGSLTETPAYSMAQLPLPWQNHIYNGVDGKPPAEYSVKSYATSFSEIEKIECGHGNSICSHVDSMLAKSAKKQFSVDRCHGCCLDCDDLIKCGDCCSEAYAEHVKLRSNRKKEIAHEKIEKEQKTVNAVNIVCGSYDRIRAARQAKGISIEQVAKTAGMSQATMGYYENPSREKRAGDPIAFGYDVSTDAVTRIVAMADLLNVSTDFLLGRTEKMQSAAPKAGKVWHSADETPEAVGDYLCLVKSSVCMGLRPKRLQFDGEEWFMFGAPLSETAVELILWTEFPEV